MNSQTLRTLQRELGTLQRSPQDGFRIKIDERNMCNGGIEGIVEGPNDTPFENGYFRVKFDFTDIDFPNMPPKCTMLTKIFHPNISKSGEICVDTLKKGWLRSYGIGHVLITIRCLLIYPNPESALNEEAGKLFMEDYQDYTRMAKLMTSVHATPKNAPAEFANAAPRTSSTSTTNTTATPPPTQTTTFPSSSKAAMMEAATTSSASSSPMSTSTATFSTSSRPAQPLQTHAHQPQAGPGAIVTNASVNIDGGLKSERIGATVGTVTPGTKPTTSAKVGGAGTANKARRGLKRL